MQFPSLRASSPRATSSPRSRRPARPTSASLCHGIRLCAHSCTASAAAGCAAPPRAEPPASAHTSNPPRYWQWTSDRDLREMGSSYGTIVKVQFKEERRTGKSLGCATSPSAAGNQLARLSRTQRITLCASVLPAAELPWSPSKLSAPRGTPKSTSSPGSALSDPKPAILLLSPDPPAPQGVWRWQGPQGHPVQREGRGRHGRARR